jgi:hypothetical protein
MEEHMKKLMTIVIAAITVATLVSCGAQSQDRQGFTKAVENGTDEMTRLNGAPAESNYVYATQAVTTSAQLTAMNVNLAGLLSPEYASLPITYFGMAVIVNSANTEALLAITLEFEAYPDSEYKLTIPAKGTITNKNGLMQINFSDDFGILALTSTPTGASAIAVTIKDSGQAPYFAKGTPFALIQVPTVASTTK